MTSHHPEDEKHGYCGNCHEFTGRLLTPPPGINFWVNAIVANRNKQPYVQLSNDKGMIGQFTMAEARDVANNILLSASRAEADAMILKFFDKEEFPAGAAAAIMHGFREFRHALDMEEVERTQSDPDTGEMR
jgi:hypothetical protein